MEFMEGVKVTDLNALDRLKVDKKELAELIARVYSEQTFVHGFVHADPYVFLVSV